MARKLMMYSVPGSDKEVMIKFEESNMSFHAHLMAETTKGGQYPEREPFKSSMDLQSIISELNEFLNADVVQEEAQLLIVEIDVENLEIKLRESPDGVWQRNIQRMENGQILLDGSTHNLFMNRRSPRAAFIRPFNECFPMMHQHFNSKFSLILPYSEELLEAILEAQKQLLTRIASAQYFIRDDISKALIANGLEVKLPWTGKGC